MELFDLWGTWWEGGSVQDQTLWGIQMLWWGRIGKLLQFVGALTIVAEIVGPERIRHLGNLLKGMLRPAYLFLLTAVAISYVASIMRSWPGGGLYNSFTITSWEDLRYDERLYGLRGLTLILIVFGVALAAYLRVDLIIVDPIARTLFPATPPEWLNRTVGNTIRFLIELPWRVFVVLMSGGILTVVLFAFLWLVVFLGDALVLEPIALILLNPRFELLTKIFSACCLLIGFHFDLLSDA